MEACDVCLGLDDPGSPHTIVDGDFEIKIKRLKGGHSAVIHLCRAHAITVQVDKYNTIASISDEAFQDAMERADREMGDPNP